MNRLLYETIQFSPFLTGETVALSRQFEAAAAAGFDGVGVDVWTLEHHVDGGGTLDDVVEDLARSGLPCVELQAVGLGHGDGALTKLPVAELLAAFTPDVVLAGCDPVLAGDALAAAHAAVELITSSGACVAIEFLPMLPLDDIAKARHVASLLGEGVGVCVDTWHFFQGRDSWTELEALPGSELLHIQFNDGVPPSSSDLMEETLQRRALPGEGTFELDRFAQLVGAKGYAGAIAVEIMSAPLRALGPEKFALAAMSASARYWRRGPERD